MNLWLKGNGAEKLAFTIQFIVGNKSPKGTKDKR